MSEPARKRSAADLSQSLQARETILQVALKEFGTGGFDGASLQNIARMAEVAPSLINYHFGSKEGLWRETVEYSLGQLRREASTIRKATRSLAPLDRLRALLQALTNFASSYPDHFGMILAESRSSSERFAWIEENYTGVIYEDLISILQDAKDQSLIKDVALDKLALMLMGGILINFTFHPLPEGEEQATVAAEEYTDLMFTMLLDGLAIRRGDA